ncbi:MAG: GNAT family N-acetyltransferase [Lachnospiraceae bacterium]|nr:GNAT family N-acetyltransferase [Lachnospiraceae bacterium]
MIRQATLADLDAVTALEAACFPAAEAATRESMEDRLKAYRHCFWVDDDNGHIRAFINGMTTDEEILSDDMYEPNDKYREDGAYLMIFGVDTHPDERLKGLASGVMYQVIADCRAAGRKGIKLTCKEEKIPFYQRFGFEMEGVSESTHGGAVWYAMQLKL